MRASLSFLLLLLAVTLYAQGELTTVSGRVVNKQNGRALAHVSVSAPGQGVSTVTNDDGEFVLKTQSRPSTLLFTHLGFHSQRVALDNQTSGLKIRLAPSAVLLDEVVVSSNDPMELLRAAIHKIPSNYPLVPSLMHCFYRETAQKGSRFIAVSEAVTDMYKTSYRYGPDQDAVQIVKGRRLMSTRASDTLGVKVMGGPIIPIMLDVVKNVDVLLNENELYFYRLTLDPPEVIAERPQFVINIRPQYVIDRPLFYGRLFIDQESLAFTRVELQLDMSDKANATQYMLVRKPRGLRFNPKELSTIINYKTIDGVTRISYVRNVMRFKCDWRRRLFASTYTVTTEMVVTENLQGDAVHSIRGRDSFGRRDLFYDKVAYFDEPDFWGNYNIIEPTESLEHAIDRLKKLNK